MKKRLREESRSSPKTPRAAALSIESSRDGEVRLRAALVELRAELVQLAASLAPDPSELELHDEQDHEQDHEHDRSEERDAGEGAVHALVFAEAPSRHRER